MSFLERVKNLKNFKKGVTELTPEQKLSVTKTSTLWGGVGLTIAFISMVYTLTQQWNWQTFGFSIFVFFMIAIQGVQYLNARQQLDQIAKMKKQQADLLKLM